MAVAAAVAAILRGASILRVHDVADIRPAILTADELLQTGS
jgi:dihydropteroate synthase